MENEFGALKMQFRGKDGFENTWLYGDLVHRKNPPTNVSPLQINGIGVVTETVGMYSGLHDKNKDRIYEGDVVRWFVLEYVGDVYGLEGDYYIREKIAIVRFELGIFMANDTPLGSISDEVELVEEYAKFNDNDLDYPANKGKFPDVDRCDLFRCQILGNIFDNPDLLNDINE